MAANVLKLLICFIFLVLSASSGMAQALPGFLQNPRFNRPGKDQLISEQAGRIRLQSEEPSSGMVEAADPFALVGGKEVFTWGRGKELPGVFFKEELSSIFSRELRFESYDFSEGLFEWVFTGDKAGINLAVSADTIWFFQRYYDSYGLNQVQGSKVLLNRHPEKIWLIHAVPCKGQITSLRVTLDHRMILTLHANGVLLSKQSCLIDVTEHQLRYTGASPAIRGRMMKPAPRAATITADWSDRRQQMLGWGGIATPTAYHLLSEKGKAMWWEYLEEYNLLLHREYPNGQNLDPDFSNWDRLEDATPHYYGDNFPNGEISDFNYIRKVQEMGGISIFEFWRFPSWVQDAERSPDIGAYCEAILNYCRTAEEKTGRPPAIVGIQNEVTQTKEDWHTMTLALRKTLDENGYEQVRIHQQDMGRLERGIYSAAVFAADPEVWEKIDYAASHMYDYQQYFHDPDGYDSLMWDFRKVIGDKPFLSTELCINRPPYQAGTYNLAFSMAQLYHKNLSITNASAIMYCWIILNTVQPSYEASRSLFGVDKTHGFIPYPSSYQLRTFGAYSRRIKRDMHRVEAGSSDPDLLVTAYLGDQGKTMVLLNRSQQTFRIRIPAGMESCHVMERVSQYAENRVVPLEGIDDAALQIEILPGEIITLSTVPLNEGLSPAGKQSLF